METTTCANIWANDLKFKSYYVVWKLKGFCGRVEGEDQFKSYYVVWKLNNQSPSTKISDLV